jgi:purine-binding chemotaxis protein CheW
MNQYLSFELSQQLFCTALSGVREVRRLGLVTPIPQSPQHMVGVINLRGDVVPVLDLPAVLGLPVTTNLQPSHIVIVVQLADRLVALLVDAVSDVFEVAAQGVLQVPSSAMRSGSQYIGGMILRDQREALVLQIEQVIQSTLVVEAA